MQTDFNLPGTMGKIGAAAVLIQVPKGLKNWHTALVNYINEEGTELPDSP